MEYVEILRARRILIWYGALLIAGLVITAISFYAGHAHNSGDGSVRFSALVGGAAVAALIIATFMVPGLSAEAAHTTALIWTRPAPRDAIALRFVAVDLATILIGYLIMIVAVVGGTAEIGGFHFIEFNPALSARNFVLGFGGAAMWYAVVSVASARLPGRGPLLAGLSWGVFPIAAALIHAHFPLWLHDVVVAVNYLNPMAWMGGMSSHGDQALVPFDPWVRVAGEYLIAIAAVAASIRLWSTREA